MGSMDGRLALVTGATAGVGKAVATGLAREGAAVVVVGRSAARAEAAMADIRVLLPDAKLEPLDCDLSSQSSIRRAASDVLSRQDRLDVLVNAAAVFRKERYVTPDGLELSFATNVVAYFLLTNLLLDALKRAASEGQANTGTIGTPGPAASPARIVNVASRYGKTTLNFDDLQTAKGKYSYLRSTPPTMLARVLLTQEFGERLLGTGVVANAVHPGLVKKPGLLQDVGGPFRWVTNIFGAPADKAADTAVWLAAAPETADVSGKLWAKRKELSTPGMGSDPEARRRLWEACSRLAGLE